MTGPIVMSSVNYAGHYAVTPHSDLPVKSSPHPRGEQKSLTACRFHTILEVFLPVFDELRHLHY